MRTPADSASWTALVRASSTARRRASRRTVSGSPMASWSPWIWSESAVTETDKASKLVEVSDDEFELIAGDVSRHAFQGPVVPLLDPQVGGPQVVPLEAFFAEGVEQARGCVADSRDCFRRPVSHDVDSGADHISVGRAIRRALPNNRQMRRLLHARHVTPRRNSSSQSGSVMRFVASMTAPDIAEPPAWPVSTTRSSDPGQARARRHPVSKGLPMSIRP